MVNKSFRIETMATASKTEFAKNLGQYFRIAEGGTPVMIHDHGKPEMILIDYRTYRLVELIKAENDARMARLDRQKIETFSNS